MGLEGTSGKALKPLKEFKDRYLNCELNSKIKSLSINR